MSYDEVGRMFRKIFTFSDLNESEFSCSPAFENERWEVPKLNQLKTQLNATKGMLRTNESESWHDHTALTNRAGFVFQEVKNLADPELLTQAWLKFYECISQFPGIFEITKEHEVFQTVHLCEAPGAFITSLNHYIQSHNFNKKLQWFGVTLNPYYEGNSLKAMISDDYFIHMTQSHWLFGPNDTGDLLDPINARSFTESFQSNFAHLVTADGSIDCSDNPEDQENTVNWLKWCETIVTLSILSCGGSFVLKIFTIFEPTTVSLLYLLRLCFRELHVFKPCTSKEGNSEAYVIAIGFKRSTMIENVLRKLWNAIYQDKGDACSKPLFSLSDIQPTFIEEIVTCATTFKGYQEEAIIRNLSMYNTTIIGDQQLTALKKKIAKLYVKRYRLKRISHESFLCGEGKRQLEFLRRKFSFQKRNRTSDTIKAVMKQDFRSLLTQFQFIENYVHEALRTWETKLESDWQPNVKIVSGKCYGMICNSSFSEKLTFQVFCEVLGRSESIDQVLCEKLKRFFLQDTQDVTLTKFLKVAPLLEEGDTLDIQNVPLLSRFAASTLWLISRSFQTVEFVFDDQPCIRLTGYKKSETIFDLLKNMDRSLLSFVKISELKKGPFFDILFSYNSLLLMRYLKVILGIDS